MDPKKGKRQQWIFLFYIETWSLFQKTKISIATTLVYNKKNKEIIIYTKPITPEEGNENFDFKNYTEGVFNLT